MKIDNLKIYFIDTMHTMRTGIHAGVIININIDIGILSRASMNVPN